MPIVFGSQEAQEVLRKDKAKQLWEEKHLQSYDEWKAELEAIDLEIASLENELDDLRSERSNLLWKIRAAEKIRAEHES